MPQKNRVSRAYDRFHPRVQRWIRRQRWGTLHSIQEKAAAPILEGARDVVIAAATAGGKTEAAFLPIASRVAEEWENEEVGGLSVLYVSPLKALINDQFERLREMFEPLDVPVFRWHGDVSSSRKRRARREGGLLLITPESLEAQFIRRGHEMGAWLAPLRYVVVDELHAFIGGERGRQLQSLLHRVELAARRRVPRVALSATMGDMEIAAEFLRPGKGEEAKHVTDPDERQTVQLQVRGYEHHAEKATDSASGGDAEQQSEQDDENGDLVAVTKHLYEKLRGGRHLVFANSRSNVETCTDLLLRRCDEAGVPGEFFAHHGSLGRSLREEAEVRLRRGNKPTTIVATTTLELGIDVGSIETIAQVGPPPSVASMRQRLGRSGREGGAPAVLRVYVREKEVTPESSLLDRLRARLVRSIAMVRLLAKGWNEPPQAGGLHLSTLVQQVLSVIAQRGGLDAEQGYDALCARGPFRAVTRAQFAEVLRDLGRAELITQTHDGALVLDLKGERLVDHYEFYAAFMTPEEYRLVAEGRQIGSLPIVAPLYEGRYLIFGGQRWKVLRVNESDKVVELTPAAGGRPPAFGGGGPAVHKTIRGEMRAVYEETGCPRFVSPEGHRLLEQGRRAFKEKRLAEQVLFADGPNVEWFPWTGDRAMNVLALELLRRGFDVEQRGLLLRIQDASVDAVRGLLKPARTEGFAEALSLARAVENKQREKHHPHLGDDLLAVDYASLNLDFAGAKVAVLAVASP